MYVGVDIGSVSAKAVLMNDRKQVVEEHYLRTRGQPVETCVTALEGVLSRTPLDMIEGIAFTGSAGKLAAGILEAFFVNEIIAQSRATGFLHPEIRTVIEIGGEDSKLILLHNDERSGAIQVRDFSMNMVCAAGTGSFLDQQASRLGLTIEEFGRLALKSHNPPRIAGRCSVFAKTDMIHLQQEATPDYDIVAGLCHALARNFKSTIGKGKDFEKPISFQGGVASNVGMVKAFQTVLELTEGELLIPKHFASMGAIGAVLALMDKAEPSPLRGLEPLRQYLTSRHSDAERLDPLGSGDYEIVVTPDAFPAGDGPFDAFLGIDVGSISTNVVVIDRQKRVLSRRYLMTAGRPIEAVRQGLDEVGGEVAGKVRICGVGTTGSGRYLTGDFVGADVIKNEITAHARAAAEVDRNVDTIFEIGGQDSKYVSLENGAVVDFTMNKVCAAGTGSFLEEQAEKLGIAIKDEFGRRALSSKAPCHLGERCTVFMESDLNHHQQRGEPKDDLVAGLSYSIVYNYLNRVVEERKIGNTIFFQGGTAYNRGVKAAFEKVTGKKIIVPPHHDCMGAIGVAIIAMEESAGTSKFKGFDLSKRKYSIDTFECRDCSNNCEVRRVSVEGERPLHYGSRCGKYDEEKRESKGKHLPRLFREREKLLLTSYERELPKDATAKTIGIPRMTFFFELFPFWKAFFTELGLRVVLSDATSRDILHDGVESVVSEPCFPIKVAHGHVINLLGRKLDYIFMPCIIDMEPAFAEMKRSYNCPYVQSLPYLVRAAMDVDGSGAEIIQPVIHMERGRAHVKKILQGMARTLGASPAVAGRAIDEAYTAQQRFYDAVAKRGREVLANLPPGSPSMVIVSRPYNGCDNALNLNLPEKLRDLGVLAIPLDFLPFQDADLGKDFPDMYWCYGQRIIATARMIERNKRLHAIYITNFGCGPDSFIMKFFTKEMKGKPYLTIEVDEHSADVGAITRCEAFLDSLQHVREVETKPFRINKDEVHRDLERTIYIPYMDDHGLILAAAMRHAGIKAEALPMADSVSLELGRKHTSGKECYPCIITTGDILKKATSKGFDPARGSFFMPSALGPCRFGQYNKFHRLVLDDCGLHDVVIFILDQTKDYGKHLDSLGSGFRRRTWQAMVVVDLMQKLVRRVRPYEASAGQTDRVYREHLDNLVACTEAGADVVPVAAAARDALLAVPQERAVPKPRIGIIGEIFVRCNAFANNFVIRRIEQLGGEVSMPPLEEWLDYIDWERKRDYGIDGNYKRLLLEHLRTFVQERDLRRVTKLFEGTMDDFVYEEPTRHIIERAEPYITDAIRGEAVLSMGRAEEYVEKGFHGIVNLVPFNCLPGNIVNALLKKFSDVHPHIPVLKMAYDGLEQGSEATRLEAFMYQARQLVQPAGGPRMPEQRVRAARMPESGVAAS